MHDGSARSELFGDRNGAGRGAGAGYSQSERAAEASRDLMEAENNRMLSELGDKVSMLKQVTVDINSDVRRQNRELDGMVSGAADARPRSRCVARACAPPVCPLGKP